MPFFTQLELESAATHLVEEHVWQLVQSLATAGLAHLFLGEKVTPAFLVGAAVVISGVLLAQRQGSPAGLLPAATRSS